MTSPRSETLSIEGMHCEHCVDVVRSALEEVEGVTVEDVEIGRALVSYENDGVSLSDVSRAIDDAGYELVR